VSFSRVRFARFSFFCSLVWSQEPNALMFLPPCPCFSCSLDTRTQRGGIGSETWAAGGSSGMAPSLSSEKGSLCSPQRTSTDLQRLAAAKRRLQTTRIEPKGSQKGVFRRHESNQKDRKKASSDDTNRTKRIAKRRLQTTRIKPKGSQKGVFRRHESNQKVPG
jgi:hypothetical protein